MTTPKTGWPRSLSDHTVRLGSRGSALAVTQALMVGDQVRRQGDLDVHLTAISTDGDTSREAIATMGTTGVFVAAVRNALSRNDVDFVVHSYKDLPTAPADGLLVAAVPPREDPRDALVTRYPGVGLHDLPEGALVGTGSPRRAMQLTRVRPDLRVRPLRGNLDTRLRQVEESVDAVVLAMAGINRLGRRVNVTPLDPTVMVPAAAQAALAVECRADDEELIGLLRALNDPLTEASVDAERAFLAELGAGCTAPVACHVAQDGAGVRLSAFVAGVRSGRILEASIATTQATAFSDARALARQLVSDGAKALLDETATV